MLGTAICKTLCRSGILITSKSDIYCLFSYLRYKISCIQKEQAYIWNIVRTQKYTDSIYVSIKSISELDRKTHIKIEREFYAKSAHSLLKDKTSTITYLRIPPYFKNMEEIYKELEKMKEQA